MTPSPEISATRLKQMTSVSLKSARCHRTRCLSILNRPTCPPTETCQGIYAGNFGLGRQYALAKTVRPYRSLLQAQAIFRREVTN